MYQRRRNQLAKRHHREGIREADYVPAGSRGSPEPFGRPQPVERPIFLGLPTWAWYGVLTEVAFGIVAGLVTVFWLRTRHSPPPLHAMTDNPQVMVRHDNHALAFFRVRWFRLTWDQCFPLETPVRDCGISS